MPRPPTLTYDRGTLILHPPPGRGCRAWVDFAEWDDRVERFRVPAARYRALVEAMRAEGAAMEDRAREFSEVRWEFVRPLPEPFAHQTEALALWRGAGRRGIVVLPTGAGKTLVAHLALRATPRPTLIVVPTLDLLHQWYAGLRELLGPAAPVGLLGGGSRDLDAALLVSTYASATIEAERLGNRFGLLVFDEVHHLPSDGTRVIADFSLAPYRLGLTATPPRGDAARERLLEELVGPVVYSRTPAELAEDGGGGALAPFTQTRIPVALSPLERARYEARLAVRDAFLRSRRIGLGTLEGWRRFVRASNSSPAGRAAMRAHRDARTLAFGTEGKLDVLETLLARHAGERTLIFTEDTAMVYRVAAEFLVPAITHHTPVKERHETLARFRAGTWPVLASSRVLNEGVDVPEASVAVVMSGTGQEREHVQRLGRILRRRPGKRAVLYELVAEDTTEERVSARRRGGKPNGEQGAGPELFPG